MAHAHPAKIKPEPSSILAALLYFAGSSMFRISSFHQAVKAAQPKCDQLRVFRFRDSCVGPHSDHLNEAKGQLTQSRILKVDSGMGHFLLDLAAKIRIRKEVLSGFGSAELEDLEIAAQEFRAVCAVV